MKVTIFILAFVCTAVWGLKISPNNVIDVPDNCPEGQKPDQNGNCREEWPGRSITNAHANGYNVIDVPDNCPEGQAPDPKGKCRPIWPMSMEFPTTKNINTPKCSKGQIADQSGKCRPAFAFLMSFLKMLTG